MAQGRAGAHRLYGGWIVGISELGLQQLLDKAGAGAAGRGCLGVGAHIIERLEPKPSDRSGNAALADAVAAADFGIVRKDGDRGRRVGRTADLVALAEDQRLALVGDISLPL